MTQRVMFVSSITRYGGGERWMCDAAGGLKSKGHDVLLVSRPGSIIGEKAREAGIDFATVEMRGDLDPIAILRLARLIRSFRPDVVCPNLDREIRLCGISLFVANKLPGGIARRREARIKLIPRRGSEFPLKSKFHYRYFYTHVVHSLIANSLATKETMLSNAPWFPREKAVVIYNGIDTKVYDRLLAAKRDFRERVRKQMGLSSDDSIIVLVGELNERKGHRYIIEAASSILEAVPKARFVFVGEGDARRGIESSIDDKGLGRYFHILGFREDVPELLTASDVLVLPSRVEGFGYVLIEAMAAGLPVVASRASSITEIVEDGKTGILHDVGDCTRIAEGICRLLEDRRLADTMGKAGRALVKDRFEIDKMLDRLEEAFFASPHDG